MGRISRAAMVFVFGIGLFGGSAYAANSAEVVPLLIEPEADDANNHQVFVASLPYVIRVPANSLIARRLATLDASPATGRPPSQSPFRIRISREDISAEIQWDQPKRVDLDHLVLIDVGTPNSPVLDADVLKAAHEIAAAHLNTAPGRWMFRFIAGDERRCVLSDDLIPQRILTVHIERPFDIPLKQESMHDMANLFEGGTRSHVLVVVAPTSPVWLPRESTEWLTRGFKNTIPDSQRRSFGSEVQGQVRTANNDGIVKLTDWIAGGHLVPIIVNKRASGLIVPSQRLRLGVEEALARMTLLKPDDVARQSTQLVEYSGTVIVPLTHIQHLSSGGYTAELTIVAGNEHATSRETTIVERAVRSWMPLQLRVFRRLILLSALALFALLWITHFWRGLGDLSDKLADETRYATFAFVGLAFGLAATLVGEGYLQYAVSTEILEAGVFLTLVGFGLWLLKAALELIKRDLAFLKG